MAEFPTYEQMAKNVAEKVLDECLYDGKSIREWMKIIAEQEPKTGQWIDKEVRGSIVPYCSECGEGLDVIYHYDFCPNCGRRMIEPQESEEGIQRNRLSPNALKALKALEIGEENAKSSD